MDVHGPAASLKPLFGVVLLGPAEESGNLQRRLWPQRTWSMALGYGGCGSYGLPSNWARPPAAPWVALPLDSRGYRSNQLPGTKQVIHRIPVVSQNRRSYISLQNSSSSTIHSPTYKELSPNGYGGHPEVMVASATTSFSIRKRPVLAAFLHDHLRINQPKGVCPKMLSAKTGAFPENMAIIGWLASTMAMGPNEKVPTSRSNPQQATHQGPADSAAPCPWSAISRCPRHEKSMRYRNFSCQATGGWEPCGVLRKYWENWWENTIFTGKSLQLPSQ